MKQSLHISIVIPVYSCCSSLDELCSRLSITIGSITQDYEIILVNDSSPDQAWEKITQLSYSDNRIKGINLSRNFGQHYAITAGLDHANGDWIVVMDCDLQDKPEEIVKLYNTAQEGYDIVFGRRSQRKDTYFKKLGSSLFYKLYSYLTDTQTDGSIANFSIISNKVLQVLKSMKEQNRMYPLFVNFLGFNKIVIDIEHAARIEGQSSYTLKKLISLAIDSIVSQSNKPLRLSIKLGFLLSFFSIIYAFWLIVRYFIYNVPVEGWTSVMVSIYFIAGLLFANMGFLGLYIGKIFDETKNRPIYIIKETTFEETD